MIKQTDQQVTVADAVTTVTDERRYGFTTLLTPPGYSPKTDKGMKRGIVTTILYLAPGMESGREMCGGLNDGTREDGRSEDCTYLCLYRAGRGEFDPEVIAARIARSTLLFHDRFTFNAMLIKETEAFLRLAERRDMTPYVRLNGTSDLPWENTRLTDGRTMFETFPEITFYDYTKSYRRMRKYLDGGMPANYSLTFSRNEVNEHLVLDILSRGGNVAVVFNARTKSGHRVADPLPATWQGYTVIDGDIDDLRPLDPRNVVVGLRAKGLRARRDVTSEFIVRVARAA